MIQDSVLSYSKLIKYILDTPEKGETMYRMLYDNVKLSYVKNETKNISLVWDAINNFYKDYESLPNFEQLSNILIHNGAISVANIDKLIEQIKNERIGILSGTEKFVLHLIEKFVTVSATHDAMLTASKLYKKIDFKLENAHDAVFKINELFKEVAKINFNLELGTEYHSNWEEMYDYYTQSGHKYPSGIDWVNSKTQGGYEKGTLNIFMMRTHVGKTMVMISEAAAMLKSNPELKVLYVSLEIPVNKIAARFDWSLSGVPEAEIKKMDKQSYKDLRDRVRTQYKTNERLVLRQFTPFSLTTYKLEAYLEQLYVKKGFKPDLIAIDYLGIMKATFGDNSYERIGGIAAVLRGIGIDRDAIIFSGAQTTRAGNRANPVDISLDEIGDSKAINDHADVIIGGFKNGELVKLRRLGMKLLKNRMGHENEVLFYPHVDYIRQTVSLDRNDNELGGIDNSISAEPKKEVKKTITLSGMNQYIRK